MLGTVTIFISHKARKNQLLKKGENSFIALKDRISLSHQTNAFLFEIEGNKIFTVVSNHGINSIELQSQGKKFESTFSESINSMMNITDRDDGIHDEEI